MVKIEHVNTSMPVNNFTAILHMSKLSVYFLQCNSAKGNLSATCLGFRSTLKTFLILLHPEQQYICDVTVFLRLIFGLTVVLSLFLVQAVRSGHCSGNKSSQERQRQNGQVSEMYFRKILMAWFCKDKSAAFVSGVVRTSEGSPIGSPTHAKSPVGLKCENDAQKALKIQKKEKQLLNQNNFSLTLWKRCIDFDRCPVMLVAGDHSPHLGETVAMNSRMDPSTCNFVKVSI